MEVQSHKHGFMVVAAKRISRVLSDGSHACRYEEIESGLVWLGVAGLQDPPRPEVRGAIERCGQAGVRVSPHGIVLALAA